MTLFKFVSGFFGKFYRWIVDPRFVVLKVPFSAILILGITFLGVGKPVNAADIQGVFPTCAGVGEHVTLSFDADIVDVPVVRINQTPAVVLSHDARELLIEVPPLTNLRNGMVTISNPDGSMSRIGLRIKSREVLDGLDNDCDGFVDEMIQAGCKGRECEGIRPGQRVDIAVLSITNDPKYPLPGEQVRSQVLVSNALRTGQRAVPELVELGFYINGEQQELVKVNIDAGTTKTINFLWTATRAGAAAISVIADPNHMRVERGRADNQISATVLISDQIVVHDDLAITSLTLKSEDGVVDRLEVEVANLAGIAASGNGIAPLQIPLIVTVAGRDFAKLLVTIPAVGETETVRFPWPADAPGGVIAAQLDPRQAELELDPANNNASTDPRSTIDVAVNAVSIYRQAPIDGSSGRITASFRISNTGVDPIVETITNRISLSGNQNQVFEFSTLGLEVGESQYVSHTFEEPAPTKLRIEADVTGAITESTSDNNVFEQKLSPQDRGTDIWTAIGPTHIKPGLGATGRLMTMVIKPDDPEVIYVAAPTGSGGMPGGTGIWKTIDQGKTWNPVSDSLPSQSVRALAIPKSEPDTIYAATDGSGISGVFKSTDGGQTWRQQTAQALRPIGNAGTRMIVHPNNPDLIYLTTRNDLKLSTDGGRTWQTSLAAGQVTGIDMNPNDPQNLIAAISNTAMPTATGLYQTFDGGLNWSSQPLLGCPGGALPTNLTERNTVRFARSGNQLYAGYKDHPVGQACRKYTVYRTTGLACSVGGVSANVWEEAFSTTDAQKCGQLWSGLYADPDNPKFVYLTGTRFWTSTDSGDSFSIQSGPHADHHDFAVDPNNPRTIYSATDGGLFRSSQRGKNGSWALASAGITNMEFYDIADADTDPALVIGGAQDNGNQKFVGDNLIWESMLGGDGATVDISQTDKDVMYAMGQYADSIQRSKNGGGSFPDNFSLPVPPSSCFNLHFQSHPTNPDIFLASCSRNDAPLGGLWLRTDGSWSTVFTPSGDTVVRSTVDGPDDIYYAATGSGKLFAGVGAANFTLIYSNPVAVSVNDIEVNPDNRRQIYAAFGGSRAWRIVQLTRKNSTPTLPTVTAQDITADLPTSLIVRAIAVDRRNPFTLLAATNRGVYRGRSRDEGSTWRWSLYSLGLPTGVDVSDLHVQNTTGEVRAGTLGRGVYILNTAPPSGSIIAAKGQLSFLRVHELETGYGPANNFIDTEVVVGLKHLPHMAFGFELRKDGNTAQRRGMLDILRSAFEKDETVLIDYVVVGLTNHKILRVAVLK